MRTLPLIAILAALAAPAATIAADEHAGHQPGDAHTLPVVNAEVRKIDRDNQKVTLRHEAIPNLNMAGMTMAFVVARPAMLDGLKVGDKVRFSVERKDGRILVTRIEPAR